MPTLRINSENENQPHFVTITVIEWIEVFTESKYFQVIIDSLKFCQENKGLLVLEYTLMPNHLHLIVSAKDGHKLSQIINSFKRYTTKELIGLLEEDGKFGILEKLSSSQTRKSGTQIQLWQRENYPELILSDWFYCQKANYIFDNAVRKDFVHRQEDWLYSSAAYRLIGKRGLIEVDDIEMC